MNVYDTILPYYNMIYYAMLYHTTMRYTILRYKRPQVLIRPVRLLRVLISEGLTQANS